MKSPQTSKQVFDKHRNSLMNLLRAADVYTLLKIDDLRGENKGVIVAQEVINKSGSSHLIHSKHFFLSKDEQILFEKDGYVTEICQQVIQSSYAAIENYLINFFNSKLAEKLNDKVLFRAINKSISFRSLSWIKQHYKNFLDIDLTIFKHEDITTFTESWFHPDSEWHGLTILSQVRNEIAHNGECHSHSIHYPVDAYSVINFIERWVMFFDLKYANKSS